MYKYVGKIRIIKIVGVIKKKKKKIWAESATSIMTNRTVNKNVASLSSGFNVVQFFSPRQKVIPRCVIQIVESHCSINFFFFFFFVYILIRIIFRIEFSCSIKYIILLR